jgi:hypothetical protein
MVNAEESMDQTTSRRNGNHAIVKSMDQTTSRRNGNHAMVNADESMDQTVSLRNGEPCNGQCRRQHGSDN